MAKRPRELWHSQTPDDSSDESDDDGAKSRSSSSSKRQRFGTPESSVSSSSGNMLPISSASSFHSKAAEIKRDPPTVSMDRCTCDLEDWEDLKELFSKADEAFESGRTREAATHLTGVIRECTRFWQFCPEPSSIYLPSKSRRGSPEPFTSPTSTPKSTELVDADTFERNKHSRRSGDPPTAFYHVFGTALFQFGSLIAQDSSLRTGEFETCDAYWTAALDVFETGENLQCNIVSQFSGDDWRMAISWGRTLVCMAQKRLQNTSWSTSETKWPRNSPFYYVARRRPPVTRRMSLEHASPHDILTLAMDQFLRGIFHMPHSAHRITGLERDRKDDAFSRSRVLSTIGAEVLVVAEQLPIADNRQFWARWVDSIFNQMKGESDMVGWRSRIATYRGRCWLIIGTSQSGNIDAALASGDESVLESQPAQQARSSLEQALGFLERSKFTSVDDGIQTQNLQPLLVQALTSIAKLTREKSYREQLLTRVKQEAGEQVLDDLMDTKE